MFGDPAGDSLADFESNLIQRLGMAILRRFEAQLVVLQDINKRLIGSNHVVKELDDPIQHGLKGLRCCQATADFMEKIELHVCRGGLTRRDSATI